MDRANRFELLILFEARNGDGGSILRVPLRSRFVDGGSNRESSFSLRLHPLLGNWLASEHSRALDECFPGYVFGNDCLTIDATDRDGIRILIYGKGRISATDKLVEKHAEKFGGSSFQLSLCIAAWALSLGEITGEPEYVEAAKRFVYTGSVDPTAAIQGVEEKLEVLAAQVRWPSRPLLVLTPASTARATQAGKVEYYSDFKSVFARVFSPEHGCRICRFEDAVSEFQGSPKVRRKPPPPAPATVGTGLALLLAAHLPKKAEFERVCRAAQIPFSRTCADGTAAERWHAAVRYCCDANRWPDLHGAIAERATIPGWADLAGTDAEGLTAAEASTRLGRTSFQPREKLVKRFRTVATPALGERRNSRDGARLDPDRVRDFLGLCGVEQVWGTQADLPPILEAELVQRLGEAPLEFDEPFRGRVAAATARHEAYVHTTRGFKRSRDAAALAADYFARWFERDERVETSVLTWMLDVVCDGDEPDQRRRATSFQLILRWRGADAVRAAHRWADARSRRPAGPLVASECERTLDLLKRFDVLLRQAAADPVATVPYSVQWAYMAGMTDRVPEVLEQVGERDVRTYLCHLSDLARAGTDREVQATLARGLRRLAEGGADIADCHDDGLRRALAAAVPGASNADLQAVRDDPVALEWWLDVIPFTADRRQVGLLCEVYRAGDGWTAQDRRNCGKARRALAAQFDVAAVRQGLGKALDRWERSLVDEERDAENLRAALPRQGRARP